MDHASHTLQAAADQPALGNPRADRRVMVIALVLFAAISFSCAAASKGFLEGDSCTHYLISRFALDNPRELVGVWGRPVVTALYALPAVWGRLLAVRATSLSLAIIAALVTWRVARNQGYRSPVVAAICLLGQPLFFLHSFSELTELPFATLLILAFWAYQARRFWLMALIISISPATRPEGFGFVLLAGLALVVHRRWWWLVILPAPLLIWSYIGWKLWGSVDYGLGQMSWLVWLKKAWPYSGNSAYTAGPIYGFLIRLPVVTSPFLFPFLWLGIWRSMRRVGVLAHHPAENGGLCPPYKSHGPNREVGEHQAPVLAYASTGTASGDFDSDDHRRRCQWLIAVLPLLIFVGHSLLWWRGKMASSGELRYMLVVGPFWALLCGKGWEWAFDTYWPWRRAVRWAALAVMLPVLANAGFRVAGPDDNWGLRILPVKHYRDSGKWAWVAIYPRVVPLPAYQDDVLGAKIAQWYRSETELARQYPVVMATPPSVWYSLDISKSDLSQARACGKSTVADPAAGAILIWDEHYGTGNSSRDMIVTMADIKAAGWVWYRTFRVGQTNFEVFLSPKTIKEEPTGARYPEDYRLVKFKEWWQK